MPQGHSYYQIAVNPTGAIFDADMKDGTNLAWSSSAQIAVFKCDTFWKPVLVRTIIASASSASRCT